MWEDSNPRIIINSSTESTDTNPGWHTTYAGAWYSSNGISGFANNVSNVVVHEFNMWLADGINAPSWGEVMTQVVGSTPSGTAANGWAVEIFDNPWPQAGYGDKLVRWYDVGYWDDNANTDSNPLVFGNGGTNFDLFSLTVDINPTDVHGNQVDFNASQRIWLGTMLPVSWTDDPDDLVYINNHRFEGTIYMAPIPEPATMLLFGLGLLGVAGVSRRKN